MPEAARTVGGWHRRQRADWGAQAILSENVR
jgi:hypothetical protein